MSTPGRPKGEYRSAQHEGSPVNALRVAMAVDTDRRGFLAGGVGLMVSLALPLGAQAAGHDTGGPSPERLDSWLALDADGNVMASVGKIDAGLGVPTAFAQIVADELDVAIEKVRIRMGDTTTTVDQRGTGSSNGITDGGSALRSAAAQARLFLLGQAAARLRAPVEQLEAHDGIVRVKSDPSRTVSYAELLRDGRFDIAVDVKAKPAFKDARDYRYVGRSVPRADIAAKATAEFRYMVDFALPGMVHARVLRPPSAGAKLLGVESAPQTPGFIKLVTLGDFAAVVCEREEQAVQAMREVRLRWSAPTFAFSRDYDALYETLRTAPAKGSKIERSNGDVDAALQGAARRLEAAYEYPFQSHACMGPACAVAQIGADAVTVWMGGQKPYPLRHA
ncbi:MAG: molybdopterin-dependent oxidoreductase, partial [Pseudomonadota bacterium]|nr:molybdopterin-dependent oxidoreductase [Pseudomonadota bacterium]